MNNSDPVRNLIRLLRHPEMTQTLMTPAQLADELEKVLQMLSLFAAPLRPPPKNPPGDDGGRTPGADE